jgi:hypothetical protein
MVAGPPTMRSGIRRWTPAAVRSCWPLLRLCHTRAWARERAGLCYQENILDPTDLHPARGDHPAL